MGTKTVSFSDDAYERLAAAKRASRINAELHEDGQPIDVEDVMIAAVALENDEAVVTVTVTTSNVSKVSKPSRTDYIRTI